MSPPRLRWLVGGLCALALACGCSDSGTDGKAKKYRIAVIPKGTTHPFWKYIHAGANAAARERGNVEIAWDGPPKESEREKQRQIVERFTSEGVDAIVLAPCDKNTLVTPVESAIEQGIPVAIIDSGLNTPPSVLDSDKYLGYIATDNRQGGVEAANRLLHLLKDEAKPKVLMIRYQAGSESTEQRERGFVETMNAAKGVELRVSPDEAGATVDTAQQAAERLLSDQKDLDGLFTPNESSTLGALRALESLGLAGKITLVGFDFDEDLKKSLEQGKVKGLVVQDPFGMGYKSVMRAVDYLEGKKPKEKTVYTDLLVITRENMNKPRVKNLYDRDLSKYLGE
jgi:ribose transport system substrate-binding protein